MSDGWRLKKRLTMPPLAPKRVPRRAMASGKRASLQLVEEGDADPWMAEAAATVGAPAPLSTSSSDDERPPPKMARITPAANEPVARDEAAARDEARDEAHDEPDPALPKLAEEGAKEEEPAKEEETKGVQDLAAHEPPLPPSDEEDDEEDAEEPTDELLERETPEEMGQPREESLEAGQEW